MTPQRSKLRIAAAVALCWPALASADEPEALLQTVEIVGATPWSALGQPRSRVPAHVQSLDAEALGGADSLNLADVLRRRLGGVSVNEIQGNAWQPDIQYRGFTASPLLGTPQGLSLYLDGVRMNQPFGDVVSWDLIPRAALESLTLVPGSNPLFGLNTLGGALSLRSKDGLRDPGTELLLQGGSHGRREFTLEHGGHDASGWHWYSTAAGFRDSGWRVASPSRLGQWFGKLGWSDARTELALSAALSSSKLTGNGLQEGRLMQRDYASVYTQPDQTRNHGGLLNLTASHAASEHLQLSGNAYYRRLRSSTLNGDMNDDSLDQSVYQPNAAEQKALAAAGYTGFPTKGANAANTPFPFWRCIANVLRQDEPAEKCNGMLNRTSTHQSQYGLALQGSWNAPLAGHEQQLTAGAALDASTMSFRQSAQFGYLNPDRSIAPVDFFADGTERDDSGAPVDTRVDLSGRSRTASLYASDTLGLAPGWYLTLSGRYNRTTVHNRDHLQPGGGPGSLDGDHRFGRFNPSLGLSWEPAPALQSYLSYGEASRTPTAIELGCADPANPCKLPNAMAGDPPLRQVVAKSWEAGLRGGAAGALHWHAGVFRTDSVDDILFVADNTAGFGYFRNVGRTRRQGLELELGGQHGALNWSAHYTWLAATFRSVEVLNSPYNSSADAQGNIVVQPGDRLPLQPRQVFKARVEWRVTPRWAVEGGLQAVSASPARGNENGRHLPDGLHTTGSGWSAGYGVVDLMTNYQATSRLRMFAQVSNLFDRRYTTAAQLNASGLTAEGNFIARPFSAAGDNASLVGASFFAPGAPRAFSAGLRYAF